MEKFIIYEFPTSEEDLDFFYTNTKALNEKELNLVFHTISENNEKSEMEIKEIATNLLEKKLEETNTKAELIREKINNSKIKIIYNQNIQEYVKNAENLTKNDVNYSAIREIFEKKYFSN